MFGRLVKLSEAVRSDDVGSLKALLTPQNVNFVDMERRMTLLMLAVSSRSILAVEALLDSGASLYPYDVYQFNVVHYAAWCADVKMMELILFCTPSSESLSCESKVPKSLHASAPRFRPGARALVDLPHSYTGRTPLMFAAMRGDAAMVGFLLSTAGSDPCLKDGLGRTAMDLAALSGHKEVVALLLSKEDGDADLLFDHTRRQAESNCDKAMTLPQLQTQKELTALLCSDWLPQSLVALH